MIYELKDEAKNATAEAARDFFVKQATQAGATLRSGPDGYQATFSQTVNGARLWYLYEHGSGNETSTGSYKLTTLTEAPFPREVEARAMPPEGLTSPGKTCGPPPWLTRSFPQFRPEQCDFRDFDSIKIETPDGDRVLAGRILTVRYALADPARDPVALLVVRNFREAFASIGAAPISAPDDLYTAIANAKTDHGEFWFIYRHGDGNENSTGRFELTTVQIGGPPPKACTLEVYGVNFDFDKAVPREDSEPVLKQVLALFIADPAYSAEVGGHTDNVGKSGYNLKLSDARARAVKAWLIANGVAASRIEAKGYGDTKPLAPNDSDDHRAKNRRVELKRAHCGP